MFMAGGFIWVQCLVAITFELVSTWPDFVDGHLTLLSFTSLYVHRVHYTCFDKCVSMPAFFHMAISPGTAWPTTNETFFQELAIETFFQELAKPGRPQNKQQSGGVAQQDNPCCQEGSS